MTKATLIFVMFGLIVSAIEGAADAAIFQASDVESHGHELHPNGHDAAQHHDDAEGHFCHCGVHAPALLTVVDLDISDKYSESIGEVVYAFASRVPPLLLRPPII
jgi:hypothetical protein